MTPHLCISAYFNCLEKYHHVKLECLSHFLVELFPPIWYRKIWYNSCYIDIITYTFDCLLSINNILRINKNVSSLTSHKRTLWLQKLKYDLKGHVRTFLCHGEVACFLDFQIFWPNYNIDLCSLGNFSPWFW